MDLRAGRPDGRTAAGLDPNAPVVTGLLIRGGARNRRAAPRPRREGGNYEGEWTATASHGRSDLITASEIASYAFCPEAWRLEHGLGLPAENQAALAAGTSTMRKAAAEQGRGLVDVGWADPADRRNRGSAALGAHAMTLPVEWIAAATVTLVLGLLLLLAGRGLRRRRGLGTGRTRGAR